MWLRRLMAGLLAVTLASSLGGRQAQAQSNQTFPLAAGGRAVITFEAFCIDFGGSFPQSIQAPSSLAPSTVRAALAYIQTNNMSAQPATALRTQGSGTGCTAANVVGIVCWSL